MDFFNRVSKLCRNLEETQSISRDALETSFKEGDFASLSQKDTLPANKFLIKILNEIIPKGVQRIRPQRETQINTREGTYKEPNNFSYFILY